MNLILQPWQLLLVIVAGWVHRQQQEVIDYLRTESQVLKEEARQATYSLERRPAAAVGRQSQGARPQAAGGSRHAGHAGYLAPMAPDAGR